jgi:GTP cyclohydrolase II
MSLRRVAVTRLPTRFGAFQLIGFESQSTSDAHLAIAMGDLNSGAAVLVRIHSECFTGEVLGSLRCDCRAQLDLALEKIAQEGAGVVVYLRGQEGRGIGLINKLKAYSLQDSGLDTIEANDQLGLPNDSRSYSPAVEILKELGITRIRLMTNNPEKLAAVVAGGLIAEERVSLQSKPTPHNEGYLRVKRDSMGHLLD